MNTLSVNVTSKQLPDGYVLLTAEHEASGCMVRGSCQNEDAEEMEVELRDELSLIMDQTEWWVH